MEISILSEKSIRIKGKNAVLRVDPSDNKTESNADLFLSRNAESFVSESGIVIDGPGEYETGGINITGTKVEESNVYTVIVDSVSILVGNAFALEKIHTKLKEANILIVNSDTVTDVSFISALVTNVVIFYGEKAGELCKSFGQENPTKASKYVTTIDKLPAEVETVILS